MDSGYLEPGETLEGGYDVLRTLLPEEVIGIMDQILCHEVNTIIQGHISRRLFIHGDLGCMAHGPSTLTDSLYILVY